MYAAELLSLKTEITSLRTLVTSAVEQIKSAIASLHTNSTPQSNTMENDAEHPMETKISHQPPIDMQDVINDLKHKIATIVIETRAMFNSKQPQ